MTNAGAKFIARGMPVRTFEEGIMQRIVIAEFDSAKAAEAAFTVMRKKPHLHFLEMLNVTG